MVKNKQHSQRGWHWRREKIGRIHALTLGGEGRPRGSQAHTPTLQSPWGSPLSTCHKRLSKGVINNNRLTLFLKWPFTPHVSEPNVPTLIYQPCIYWAKVTKEEINTGQPMWQRFSHKLKVRKGLTYQQAKTLTCYPSYDKRLFFFFSMLFRVFTKRVGSCHCIHMEFPVLLHKRCIFKTQWTAPFFCGPVQLAARNTDPNNGQAHDSNKLPTKKLLVMHQQIVTISALNTKEIYTQLVIERLVRSHYLFKAQNTTSLFIFFLSW